MAVIAASLFAAGAAQAQDGDGATEVEEVVVTGFRGSLASALSAKREETAIVDSIKAEDIADFPDANLVEAIQRIPGVSIDRDAGEGRTMTVRGLGPDFTRTRINGMEAQATAGGTDSSGGANRGRGFDFNVFASELFNSVTVRKTQSAEVEEGSLGATVDLRTTRPFDFKGRKIGGSIQYGYNDLSEEWDPRFAVLLSDTFLDGKLGLLASLAYSERNLLEEGFSAVRWERASDNGGFQNPAALPGGAGNAANLFHPRLPRYGQLIHDQKRTGFTGAIQYRPWDTTTFSYDLLYSKLDAKRTENFLESLSLSRNASAGGKPQIDIVSASESNGMLISGVFNDVDVRSEQRYDEMTTEFTQQTFTIEHEFTPDFSMKAFVGRAVSEFENPIQTTVTLDRQDTDGYAYDFSGNGNTPRIDYGFDVTDPAMWSWRQIGSSVPRSEIRIRPGGVENVFESLQFDFDWRLNDTFNLKFGYNYKTYESDSYESRRADETVVPALPVGVTVADISTLLTGFGKNLGQPNGNATSWLIPNLNAVADLFDIYCNCDTGVPGGNFTLTSITNGNARGSNRFIREEDRGYYLQLDFDSQLMGFDYRGNLGFRQVNTKLFAEGYSSVGGGTKVHGTNDYDNFLPSFNLSVNATDNFIIRFGAAEVMARPQIGNGLAGTNYLVPTTSLAASGPNFTASIGNVKLEPFQAKTYDLSFEWYFAPESLLSVAFFKKDIDTYIQIIRQDLPYSDLMLLNPSAFTTANCVGVGACTLAQVFQLTSAVNTEGGPLTGFEISYQQPFSFLPAPFDRFGIQANYTQVKSEIDYCNGATCATFVTDDLVNLSPKAYNATLYYEDDRFSARISASFREGYLQNVPGRNNNALEGKKDTFNLDFASSFKVNDQFSVTFEALNLTDEFNQQWVGTEDRQSTSVYHHTGTSFYFGLKYTF
jgi:TonB-dependent receptor